MTKEKRTGKPGGKNEKKETADWPAREEGGKESEQPALSNGNRAEG